MIASVVLCALVALAAATRDYSNVGVTRQYLEDGVPKKIENGWQLVGKAPHTTELELIVAINGRNTDKLEPLFHAVSDPTSDKYGQHLTLTEVTETFGADDLTIAKLTGWVESSGARVVSVSTGRAYMTVAATVAAAEALLETEFHQFKHPMRPQAGIVRSLAPYSAPNEVAPHVAYVAGVHHLPVVKPRAKAFDIPGLKKRAGNPIIGPKQLRQRYNITTVGTNHTNSQAVAEFQGQYYSPSDLKQFFAKFVSNSKADTVAGVIPAGGNQPGGPGVEASLDIQYIMGVAPDVKTYFYIYSQMDFWTGLSDWANGLDSQHNPPHVHSISYGAQGAYQKPSSSYQSHMTTTFQKLGLRGMSIIFASGDSGEGCNFCVFLEPSFPATSPYVTSVGATRFLNGAVGPEGAVQQFHSGGGFSWDFPTASYQKAAVAQYLKEAASKLPFSFQYNTKGRGTPDVSALGIGFAVIQLGNEIEVGGTSASAPTFSAVISLLNDKRLNQGRSTMGFLNHWIYQTAAAHPTAFWDVTEGDNSDGCCFTGFPCAKGWDPDTGVGTPNVAELLRLI